MFHKNGAAGCLPHGPRQASPSSTTSACATSRPSASSSPTTTASSSSPARSAPARPPPSPPWSASSTRQREDHIITVEDPIEVVQPAKGCNVTQREVGPHTKSFATALKGALREDPDVIVIGELRDLETIEMAISASETGHLVIGTMHTSDAATTLNRLLDVFPPAQQTQIRSSVAESLRGVVCQRLLPRTDGGLVLACEILISEHRHPTSSSEGKTRACAT
jgi:Tfp pilus assembly pilus retraction ATPase PilT